jgi:hypothetical protein
VVEDGRPFCPQCRAPQIHVQIAVPDAEIASGADSASGEFSSDPTESGNPGSPIILAGSTMNRKAAVRAALKAGVLGFFISMIPVLGIALTGALAVYFYRRESGAILPAALASRVAGAAGVVAFAINSFLMTIQIFVFHGQQRYIDDLMAVAQKFGANPADHELQASFHNLFTPAGLILTFLFGMIFTIALASAGGALASLFMRSGNPRA